METYKEFVKRRAKEEAKKRELMNMVNKADNDKQQRKLLK